MSQGRIPAQQKVSEWLESIDLAAEDPETAISPYYERLQRDLARLDESSPDPESTIQGEGQDRLSEVHSSTEKLVAKIRKSPLKPSHSDPGLDPDLQSKDHSFISEGHLEGPKNTDSKEEQQQPEQSQEPKQPHPVSEPVFSVKPCQNKGANGRIHSSSPELKGRFKSQYIFRKSAAYLVVFSVLVIIIRSLSSITLMVSHPAKTRHQCVTKEFGSIFPNNGPISAFPAPENNTHRLPDTVDTLIHYKYRNHSDTSCRISSLDLHSPFAPLCNGRAEVLQAISGGGRIGFEAPFMPRDCDMRWFTTEEVCEILSRFEKVVVVGDSMMRHVVGALNVLLRKDLGYGAVTNWNFDGTELQECFCNSQFDVKSCSLQGIYSTSSVRENDPDSLACSEPVDLIIEMMLKFPLDPVEVSRFQELLSPIKPTKPYAFVFGHGLWNDLDLQATMNWLDGILAHSTSRAPYLGGHPNDLWPRLIITPNAAGVLKPDQWITSQGDKALQIFEHAVRAEAMQRGLDHLGTWNMSIQADKYDGVHLDLKGNLVKAMAVVNWLAWIEVDRW